MALASQGWLAGVELGNRFSGARLIRSGSRFDIYEVHETSANRTVVIKLPGEASAPWLHEILDHEAAVLAAIGSHPNVITFYQRIELDDGRPALVLERCPGSFAEELRGGGQVSAQAAVSIGIKLAGALETVHNAGVLHCDVRPRTVLVTEWGEPVLAGFDEAVRIDSIRDRSPLHVTSPHTAPELLEGDAPTPASDVYGLASTMYELVAGRAAFRAYAGESPATVIVRVLSGTVAPLAGVPLEMSDLLTWAMSPDPTDRPPSPSWLAEELARIELHQQWPRTRMLSN